MSTKHNIYLFQPQHAVEFRKEINYWIPYSVGCLWSYASQFTEITDNFHLAGLIFRREDPAVVLSRMENPVYCGFSAYTWNSQYCLVLAEMIKKQWPNCIIQFGGPNTNGKWLKHNFIDSIVAGEGEEKFVESLLAIQANKEPPLLSQKQRLQQLDIPSPYTTGVFDQIMLDNPGAIWSVTIETNRGCPYACTFCDWGGVTYSKIKKFELERIRQDLEWMVTRPVSYLVLGDANFGIFKQRDLEIAHMIRSAADRGRLDSININYAKNSTDVVFEIAKIIGPYSRGITVSVQSMNTDTLSAVNRENLDVNNIAKMMAISENTNVSTYTEVILGLPLETLESWKQGLAELLELGQHKSIDVWFAQLLENSELSQDISRRKYGISAINASDYTASYNTSDYKGIDEQIELISSTNTMSTTDIVEGSMYAWMIINFHVTGYTQYLSKYARYKKNISYRKFYDNLFEKIKNTEPFKEYFTQVQHVLQHYLTTGKMLEFDNHNQTGHTIHHLGGLFIYQNRQLVYKMSQQMLAELTDVDPGVISLQEFGINQQYPVRLNLDFDIKTWQDVQCRYIINSSVDLDDKFDFYANRRKGLLKNTIEVLND